MVNSRDDVWERAKLAGERATQAATWRRDHPSTVRAYFWALLVATILAAACEIPLAAWAASGVAYCTMEAHPAYPGECPANGALAASVLPACTITGWLLWKRNFMKAALLFCAGPALGGLILFIAVLTAFILRHMR